MAFRILGPRDVTDGDGRPVKVEPRQATILAVLLLGADQTVPVAGLVDALWPHDPPATARRQVQNGVWLLRRCVPIVGDRQGYRLPLAGHSLDARMFADEG